MHRDDCLVSCEQKDVTNSIDHIIEEIPMLNKVRTSSQARGGKEHVDPVGPAMLEILD